ncbi:MAG: peroxidase family protein [Planctomycetota bacterium]
MTTPSFHRAPRSLVLGPLVMGAALLATQPRAQAPWFRTFDGGANNPNHPDWGRAGQPLLRRTTVGYADGRSAPAGGDRPSARAISNAVAAQVGSLPNRMRASDFVWQWGQFLDHDLDLTEAAQPEEPLPIAVPRGDPWFDPLATGVATIALSRSGWVEAGVREQVNEITAWIDASNVYGSDAARAAELRLADGRLATSDGGLLPFNLHGFANAPSPDPTYFLAGDVRANEQVGLTALHTLFVREHNRIAVQLRLLGVDAPTTYDLTRMLVGAEVQAITYNEFLPVLLGRPLRAYGGYRPDVEPGIANEFATAAYRLGHSMLSATILRLDADGQEIAAGHLALRDAFFAPREIVEHGIEPLLRGLAAQPAQELDTLVVDDVRNFLFGPPGAGGFDLASLNIQRGRDHGLPSYNRARSDLGLRPARSFADVSSDPSVRARLAAAYETVDDVDLWVGGLAEDHVSGALVGPLFHRILSDQFERLRDADRHWYQIVLPPPIVAWVDSMSLSRVIRLNTTIGAELPDDVFRVDPHRQRTGRAAPRERTFSDAERDALRALR